MRSSVGVGMTPPKVEGAPNPTSSVKITRMFGAPFGGTTRLGQDGVDSRAFNLMIPSNWCGGGGRYLPSIVLVALGSPDELRAKTGKPQVVITGHGFTQHVLNVLQQRNEVESVEQNDHQLVLHMRLEPDIPTLIGLLAGEGVQVTEVHQGKANLEETYLQLMEEEQ